MTGNRLSRLIQTWAASRVWHYVQCLLVLIGMVVGLLVSTACDSPFFGGPDAWCDWMATCCEPLDLVATGLDLSSPGVSVDASSTSAAVWLEFGATGVYTPVFSHRGVAIRADDSETPPLLDDLAQKGFVAIRVPHAPPTYTRSSLLPGVPPGNPHAVALNYYSPPSTTTLTTVPVTVTRRTDYETMVNAQFPIEDGQSHWEVWWLPKGDELPIPEGPFRLEGDGIPRPVEVSLRVDLVDGHPYSLAGRDVEIVLYNGFVFIGPYRFPVQYRQPDAPSEPLVRFGTTCGYASGGRFPTLARTITSTVPFTHMHCLENWDTVTRTFTITTASSEGWDYAHGYQGTRAGAAPIPVPAMPFTVQVGPLSGPMAPGAMVLLAMHTPDLSPSAAMRETFHITATSVTSPEVAATSASFVLAPAYQLDEDKPRLQVYLPLLMRRFN